MAGMKLAGRLAAIALTAALGPARAPSAPRPRAFPSRSRASTGRRLRSAPPWPTNSPPRPPTARSTSSAPAPQARYRVRGYLSTATEDGETKVAYVWDVFDSQKRRAKRLEGSSPVPAASISSLDKQALAKLAQASMDEIADFLSAAKSETPAAAEAPIQTAEAQPTETSEEENQVAMQ